MTPSVLELLAWVSRKPRTYAEAMEAWRTTCPRHSAWEDALLEGLVEVIDDRDAQRADIVALTALGRAALRDSASRETFPL